MLATTALPPSFYTLVVSQRDMSGNATGSSKRLDWSFSQIRPRLRSLLHNRD
jgi:hypothetical protein